MLRRAAEGHVEMGRPGKFALLPLGAVLLLAACGGSNQGSTSTPSAAATKSASGDNLEVVKFGFGGDEFGSNYFVVFKNASATDRAGDVAIQFGAYDAGGKELDSTTTTETIVRAGQTIAASDSITGVPQGSKVDHVKVQLTVGAWSKDSQPDAVIEGRNPKFSRNSVGEAYVDGELVSHYQSDVSQVVAIAVCYDANQNIDGGGFKTVGTVPKGGTIAVKVPADSAADPASCRLYATLTILSITGP